PDINEQHRPYQRERGQREQHYGKKREKDAQDDRAETPEQYRLLLLFRRQGPAGHGDDYGIVTAQHDVDHHDLAERHPEKRRSKQCHSDPPRLRQGVGPYRLSSGYGGAITPTCLGTDEK